MSSPCHRLLHAGCHGDGVGASSGEAGADDTGPGEDSAGGAAGMIDIQTYTGLDMMVYC